MRKDINIDIDSRDMQYKTVSLSSISNYFQWIDNPNGLSRYIYGEINVPHNIAPQSLLESGIVVNIPYTPIYKEFYIRLRRELIDGYADYVQNPQFGGDWFLVSKKDTRSQVNSVFASELLLISKDSLYLRYEAGIMIAYNGNSTDLDVIPAYNQNSNLLLICAPGNNYRYPTTGVNIQTWINGLVNQQKYLERLKDEFYKDGVIVNNVTYDESNNRLYLDTNAQTI